MCGRPGPGFGLEDACLGARPSFSLSQTLSVPLSRHHWEQHDHPHPPCPSVGGTLSAYLPPSLVVRDECVIALSQNARGTEPDVQRGPSWPVGAPLPVPPHHACCLLRRPLRYPLSPLPPTVRTLCSFIASLRAQNLPRVQADEHASPVESPWNRPCGAAPVSSLGMVCGQHFRFPTAP